jgi:hypothetical protein
MTPDCSPACANDGTPSDAAKTQTQRNPIDESPLPPAIHTVVARAFVLLVPMRGTHIYLALPSF